MNPIPFSRLFSKAFVIMWILADSLRAQTPLGIERLPEYAVRLDWFAEPGKYYDLQISPNLTDWRSAGGFPRLGSGAPMWETRELADRVFFRVASGSTSNQFHAPEIRAYQQITGISDEAAGELDQFLRLLRDAGVEPALLWVGGSRYGSVSGSTARAVIGGNGSITGTLGERGDRYETFTSSQTIRFANPLRTASQKRIGVFVSAAAAPGTTVGEIVSGGTQANPRGPTLYTAWGGGNFQVFSASGQALNQPGFGGYAKAGAFLPYIGAVHDGYYSVLCGIGKSQGSREHPLRYTGMNAAQFPDGSFANNQQYVALGGYFSGNLQFAVVTASDLTDNRRAYELVSIPKRSGFGKYGVQTAVVFLGDSITYLYNEHVWLSGLQNPPHKAGGQWNQNCLALLGNATGEANDAQIEYFEKGARYALDPRTWDHLFYVCGSGGHYPHEEQIRETPLTQNTRNSIDAWVREYHERIAIPAAETGATVVQMTYIYGCPNKFSPAEDPEVHRPFADQFAATQRQYAWSAGFPVFDAYMIPQLHEPIAAFYSDAIHPSTEGLRLLAQEFAASVANPGSRIPRSLSRPAISGTAARGNTLTTTRGSWAFRPTNHTYQWMRDATDIPGATTATYVIQQADTGFHLSCRVTATNAEGSAERTSAHTVRIPQ